MKDSWRGRSRIRNEWENCPVSSRANSWGNTLLCWKRHGIHKAFPTFGSHISSATHIFEGFNLVINILKTDINTHHLTVPKENMKGNVKYSKLAEKCIYVSPNKKCHMFKVLLLLNSNISVSHRMLHMCVQLLIQRFINSIYNYFIKKYFLCDTVSGRHEQSFVYVRWGTDDRKK